jgi:hypothetical protein
MAGDHGAEIIPSGPDDLGDVHEKEQHITDRQGEMLRACPRVPAQQACQPGDLYGLVNRKPGQQRTGPHQYDSGIGETLRAVKLRGGQRRLAQLEVVQNHVPRVEERVAVGHQMPPLAGQECVQHVGGAIEGKEPHEREMKSHPLGEATLQVKNAIEPVGKKM